MMKTTILLMLLTLPVLGLTQKELSMQDVEGRREVSMGDVNGQSTDGVYRYYAKGEQEPFTGVLYSKHANGNIDSWQEYVDGVGQGKWINYYENGNLKEEGYYEQNRVQGPIRKYYSDGTLQAEGTYKDWRIKIGVWKYYDEDGQLAYTKNYGEKGSIEEVEEYYNRGEISYSWYRNILKKNGFK